MGGDRYLQHYPPAKNTEWRSSHNLLVIEWDNKLFHAQGYPHAIPPAPCMRAILFMDDFRGGA